MSAKRRSSIAMIDPDNNDKMKVYVKGAPELLLKLCKNYQSEEGKQPLSSETYGKYE